MIQMPRKKEEQRERNAEVLVYVARGDARALCHALPRRGPRCSDATRDSRPATYHHGRPPAAPFSTCRSLKTQLLSTSPLQVCNTCMTPKPAIYMPVLTVASRFAQVDGLPPYPLSQYLYIKVIIRLSYPTRYCYPVPATPEIPHLPSLSSGPPMFPPSKSFI